MGADDESELWLLTQEESTVEAYEQFIREFGESQHLPLAKLQIERLQNLSIEHEVSYEPSKSESSSLNYRINVQIAGGPSHLDSIEQVTYHLHKSFKNPERVVSNRKNRFQIILKVWGGFDLRASLAFRDGLIIQISTALRIDEANA
ncbi:MAG: pYEATS domain-containing protein [Bacteroidota bacterium]